MIRFLNVLALLAVIGTATWAYSVKYETVLVAEKLKKRNAELRHERDAINVLEAEWQLLNRPARLATLAKPESGMGQMSARQVVRPKDIPAPVPVKQDSLDTLLTGSLPPAPKTPAAGNPQPKAAASTAIAPRAAVPKSVTAKAPVGKASAPKTEVAKAAAHPSAPMSLTPKAATPPAKTKDARATAAKAPAPVAHAPVPTPPKPEGAGLNALFKKILN